MRKLVERFGAVVWRVAKSVDKEFNDLPSRWVRESDDKKVIIFVHGILSKSRRAWVGPEKHGWLSIIQEDSAFNGWGLVVADWYSTVFSQEHDTKTAAERLFEELSTNLGGTKSSLASKEIVFICHSMGGIVVRQMLVLHPELLKKKVGVVTLGTPALGAYAAYLFRNVSSLAGHAQALDLQPDSKALLKLHKDFGKLVKQNPKHLFGIELVERHLVGPRVRLLEKLYAFHPGPPPLVNLDSQGGYFGEPQVVFGTDHRSINRPQSGENAVHVAVQEFVERCF